MIDTCTSILLNYFLINATLFVFSLSKVIIIWQLLEQFSLKQLIYHKNFLSCHSLLSTKDFLYIYIFLFLTINIFNFIL